MGGQNGREQRGACHLAIVERERGVDMKLAALIVVCLALESAGEQISAENAWTIKLTYHSRLPDHAAAVESGSGVVTTHSLREVLS